ncbi:thioredoxin family protein [Microtetraspora malaysiensis]|uniref:thioredoxin family protein n=1 Tax=Microtetraspora malaysiensis TaxID=161358 RepID=UPI003D944D23
MDVMLLTVPDCPNLPLIEERLTEALSGRPEIHVARHIVTDHRQAQELGMHGSPTILVNGRDPFAQPGQPAGLACRLYRHAGGVSGAPSVAQLRAALAGEAGDHT